MPTHQHAGEETSYREMTLSREEPPGCEARLASTLGAVGGIRADSKSRFLVTRSDWKQGV
jgi:hypothetical protein